MDKNLTRLMGWAATLQNFGVTAVVAFVLAIAMATQGYPTEHRHFGDQSLITLSHGLGYVGMPTVAVLPNQVISIASSAAVLPQNRP
jgi:hypothetical protein